MALTAERYGVRELTVNEQIPQAVGFYEHLGISVWKRTERDEEGGVLFAHGDSLRSAPQLAMPACDARSARGVFFATYTPPQKTIRLYSRPPSRELCETFLQRNASATADAFLWGYSSFSSVFACGSGCADAAAA